MGGSNWKKSDVPGSNAVGDQLSAYSDEELIAKCRTAASQISASPYSTELVCRYFDFIKHKASIADIPANVCEDLIQEGLLGFMNAVNSFDCTRNVKFSAYAYVCVSNRIKTAAASINKIRLETPCDNDEMLSDSSSDTPESILMEKEMLSEVSKLLSSKENDVFSLYIKGMKTKDISKMLGISEKSADNAVHRAKKKLLSIIDN
ncbi:MAG: sigma-70 family RNA polymerase sigma factor [Huintestinicola sp.]